MPMGSSAGSLRARKKAATEAALQESALSLFAQKGYDATTIEEIVADADVSRRTFFRYFGSKEEVIFKGTSNDFDTFRQLLREQPEGKDLEALKRAVVQFVLYLQERKAPILEFVEVVIASPTLRAALPSSKVDGPLQQQKAWPNVAVSMSTCAAGFWARWARRC